MTILEMFILALMALAPKSRVVKDADYRSEIVLSISAASDVFDIDEYELAGVFYFESSFDYTSRSKSKLKEYGLGQIHGRAKKYCNVKEYNINSVSGQIFCTADLLSSSRDICGGSMTRGYYRYMSGSCKGTPRAKRMLRYRRSKIKKLKKRFSVDSGLNKI